MWCICSVPQWDNREYEKCKFCEYEKFNYNHIVELYNFRNYKNFMILKCRKSKQFYKYPKCEEGGYILGVLYGNGKKLDVMPCLTETAYIDEDWEDGLKRLCREELFCDIFQYFQIEQGVYSTHVNNIKWIGNTNIIEGKTDKNKKIALYIYSYEIDDLVEIIQKWRSNKHNLATRSERYFMKDLVIIKKN